MAQVQAPPQAQGAQSGPGASGPAPFASTSLYVGDLEPNVSEAQLYEVFNQVGPVVSIRVCRDLITRRSLGYAYVNYNSAQDAQRALEVLNFQPINGKEIRIMFSSRDPSSRKSGAGNIFIRNLDKGIDNKALHDTFAAFGSILSCKVATDNAGQSKGYGFVQFEAEESANQAIEKVNGMLLNEKQVYVGPFVRRQERDVGAASSKFQNVYVKNLGEDVTEEKLKEVFEEFGKTTSAVIMKEPDGKSKGFGFVNYDESESAAKAVDALNGKNIDGKEWFVGRAQKKSEREQELRNKFEQERREKAEKFQGVNLYLKNLDDTFDDEKLRELFSEFGTITSAKVMKAQDGTSKGSGFVAFNAPEEATKAVTEMNGKMVGSKPLYVALAQRKEERKQRLAVQFQQRIPQVGMGGNAPANMPMYGQLPPHGQQIFFGQPPPGLLPPQPGYGYQQQVLAPGMRPGMQAMPNYYVPVVQRQGNQGRGRGGRGGPQQGPLGPGGRQPPQQGQRQGPGQFRYGPNARNLPGGPDQGQGMPPPGLNQLPVPMEVPGGVAGPSAEGAVPPIAVLASQLASAPPEQQRAMLGEQLYPLVDALEHEAAGKVTGMLLEMDQTEVLHLIESPDALRSKVQEAIEVLKLAQQQPPLDQMGGLSLSENGSA